MLKVVLDTNIFVSSLFWKGEPNRIVMLASENKIKNFTSTAVLDELRNVLKRDFDVPENKIDEILSNIVSYSELVETGERLEIIKSDPSDNKFLEIAITVKADYIVSNDKHLLNLREFHGIEIVSAKEMLHILEK